MDTPTLLHFDDDQSVTERPTATPGVCGLGPPGRRVVVVVGCGVLALPGAGGQWVGLGQISVCVPCW